MTKCTAALLAALLLVTGCHKDQPTGPTEYDRYEQLCHDKGGVVGTVGVHWMTVEYNCIGKDFGELLPRFSDG